MNEKGEQPGGFEELFRKSLDAPCTPSGKEYVAIVDDHFDRLIWRGRYYHLKEGQAPSSETGLKPAEGYCLLQVPQQTPENPSPCAMAGYCIGAQALATVAERDK